MEPQECKTFPMFKGLQKPLEFMGLQGRYIYWAAATAAVSLLGTMAVYALTSLLWGLVFGFLALSAGACVILVKQRQGLHTKKTPDGVFVATPPVQF